MEKFGGTTLFCVREVGPVNRTPLLAIGTIAQSTIHHSNRIDRFAFMLQADELLHRIRKFSEIYGETVKKSSHSRT